MSKSRSCTQNVNVKRHFPADDEYKYAFKPCHKWHKHTNNSAFKDQTLVSFFFALKKNAQKRRVHRQKL